jgi:hypothetical protein
MKSDEEYRQQAVKLYAHDDCVDVDPHGANVLHMGDGVWVTAYIKVEEDGHETA